MFQGVQIAIVWVNANVCMIWALQHVKVFAGADISVEKMSISIIQIMTLTQITHIYGYLNPVGYPSRTTLTY